MINIDDARWQALTDEQRQFLAKLGRAPWWWFVSDRRYADTLTRMECGNSRDAEAAKVEMQRAYYATMSRVTAYTGEDFRVQLQVGGTWVRAVQWQYDYAGRNGIPRRIGMGEAAPALAAVAA